MAFISVSTAPLSVSSSKTTSTTCSFVTGSTSRVSFVPTRRVLVHTAVTKSKSSSHNVIRMDAGKYPDSAVLGLGKDIPSTLYIIMAALALPLGCYSVYMSNLFTALTPESVNPQFVVGSLLVPISWGLHVAGFIQKQNGK